MALTWDCQARFRRPSVPPQGHYSIYQVGMSYDAVGLDEKPWIDDTAP
jgi:hypothetical protein